MSSAMTPFKLSPVGESGIIDLNTYDDNQEKENFFLQGGKGYLSKTR